MPQNPLTRSGDLDPALFAPGRVEVVQLRFSGEPFFCLVYSGLLYRHVFVVPVFAFSHKYRYYPVADRFGNRAAREASIPRVFVAGLLWPGDYFPTCVFKHPDPLFRIVHKSFYIPFCMGCCKHVSRTERYSLRPLGSRNVLTAAHTEGYELL